MTGDNWKSGAAKRRDDRSTKVPDTSAPHRSSKNTKKWCRGKIGIEHTPKCVDYSEAKLAAKDYKGFKISMYVGWKILICTACGKELDHYYPFTALRKQKIPNWVK